jgi:hypothetical protein
MLRVQKIAVVSINPEALPGPNTSNRAGQMISQMLSDNVVVTMAPGKPQTAATAEEASRLAGFKVLVLSAPSDTPQFRIEGEQAFHMTLNRDRIQSIIDDAGRPDLQLPASLDGATIAVHIPKLVMARYGCPNLENREEQAGNPPAPGELSSHHRSSAVVDEKCVVLAQVPSPTVGVPRDLDISQLAEAALQLAGMTAPEAHAFCQTVDWTSTLVLPLPRQLSWYETVDVNGVEGTLIDNPPGARHRGPGYTLLWVKNGVIYSLVGWGSSSEAVPLAESLN